MVGEFEDMLLLLIAAVCAGIAIAAFGDKNCFMASACGIGYTAAIFWKGVRSGRANL